MQHTGQMRQNKSKKSLLRIGLRLMLAAIIIPLAASLLLFFGFVSRQMRTQAEHMTQYYTDQLVNSTADALGQAQSIIYFTLGSDTVQSVMHSSQNPVGTQAELVQQEIGQGNPVQCRLGRSICALHFPVSSGRHRLSGLAQRHLSG